MDAFHRHEALDRCHVILCTIDDHLLDHPFVGAHPDIRDQILAASRLLSGAYQSIGAMELPVSHR